MYDNYKSLLSYPTFSLVLQYLNHELYMKKLAIILFAILPLQVLAQVRFGIRGGLNISSISFSDFKPEKRSLPRLNAGTMLTIPIDEDWAILTGPYYSGKGVIFGRSTQTNKIDSFNTFLNYIELPVNIGYRFSSENENGMALFAGPYLSYGFNGKEYQRERQHLATTHLHKEETDQYKRLDLGFNIGVLYEIKYRYGARLDYTRSLLNTRRGFEKERNTVFGFSLFWYMVPRFKGPSPNSSKR